MTMEKTYQPHALEKKWYQYWEQSGFFSPSEGKGNYCIMLPPPNVTGTLHMGHAFQDTIMDALIRLNRMQGKTTLWQGGTDHAGIATQMVVERQLLNNGVAKNSLTREAFVSKIWEWKAQSGNTISQQMRRLGASIDWDRERFTLDEGLSEAVKKVFINLYEEGILYRGKRLVNWDPKLHTAVSDLEVIIDEEEGFLWYLRYPIKESAESLVVATTRPETMLGDVAVAVNPEDPRYAQLIGKTILLPLTNREIPIIADDYVEPEFGTGCVKITPAHDFNDYQIGKRHGLEMINILTPDAALNDNVPQKYQGLDRFVARKNVVADLESLGLLEKIEPYKINVPRADRTGEIVEPYLTDQWFVKTAPLAAPAIEAVKSGKIKFVPENWQNDYFEWMNKIEDWCISRQIWWGHRIPAWYDQNGHVYVGKDEQDVRAKYKLGAELSLKQDDDVLDTWFSSALWPFSTLGWPDKTEELSTFYPTNVLVTGFDIIFFWVARMIMMGIKFMGDIPFKEVFVHGLILDAKGQKMSKSKGNILDPIDLIDGIDLESLVKKRLSGLMQPQMAKQIEKDTRKQFPDGIPPFGTDALRFTFCALASNSRHIRFDLARVEGSRNFCNKIWNAARFVMMNVENQRVEESQDKNAYSLFDKWIWSIWQHAKAKIVEHIQCYRFDIAAQTIYEFIWNEYCDWYLEFSKANVQAGTRFTLVAILEEILRAAHPIMPYITEEIWQKLVPILGEGYFKAKPQTIMLQAYPTLDKTRIDEHVEKEVAAIKKFIVGFREIRSGYNLHPSQQFAGFYFSDDKELTQTVESQKEFILKLTKLEKLEQTPHKKDIPPSYPWISDNLILYIPGEIDLQAEKSRLIKKRETIEKERNVYKNKLDNPSYREKAPLEIVQQEEERLKQANANMAQISEYLEMLNKWE